MSKCGVCSLWFLLTIFSVLSETHQLSPVFDLYPRTHLKMQVIEHPVERLHTALLSTQKDLIETYQQFSSPEKTLLEEGLLPGNSLFNPITIHSDSDWIPAHPEDPQDFRVFTLTLTAVLQAVGIIPSTFKLLVRALSSFGEGAVVAEQYVEWLKDYCQAFYYGLVVKLLPPVTVASTACSFRINDNTHNLQLHAGELLNFLKKKKPRDAFCIVGITMIDLYPRESWNFVFGQASLTEGMGVFSFARYDDHFYQRSYAGRLKPKLKQGDYSVFENYYTPPITSNLLLRSCKTLTHEIGHIFCVKHCQWLNCVMQGSNHLEESDRRPLDLCPICLRKLQSAIGFKIAERYKALLHWIEDGAASSGQHSKPTQAFQEYKHWLYKCLRILEGEKS